MIQVLVVAPALALRAGLRALLDTPAVEVIAEAPALADLPELPPDVDVLVLAPGAATRVDLEGLLDDLPDPVGVIFMTDEPEQAQMLSGLPVRGWGLLPEDVSGEALVAAVAAVQEGLLVGTAPLVEPIFDHQLIAGRDTDDPLVETLTKREIEVLDILAQGLANKQIAAELGISEHTVKFHVSSIYSKLGATNRAEAVRLGARRGLIVL